MADLPPILARFAAAARLRADALDPAELRAALSDAPPVRPIEPAPFGIIAEYKPRSPSMGDLAPGRSRDEQVRAYRDGGALAISVLTEPVAFGGSLATLTAITRTVDIPVLRKDFVIDERQILEARAAGASGVLLMACLLDDDRLHALVETAGTLDLFVLAEAHDARERDRVRRAFDRARTPDHRGLGGINTRDFATLTTDLARLEALAPSADESRPWVAESGLHRPEDAARAARLGYRLGLVGTALMQSSDPARAVTDLRQAGLPHARPPCA